MKAKNDILCVDDTIYNTEIHEGSVKKPYKTMPDPCEVKAVIPGTIIDVKVRKGQYVTKGQLLLVLEAMKMLNGLEAEIDGRIGEINVSPGDKVEKGRIMIRII